MGHKVSMGQVERKKKKKRKGGGKKKKKKKKKKIGEKKEERGEKGKKKKKKEGEKVVGIGGEKKKGKGKKKKKKKGEKKGRIVKKKKGGWWGDVVTQSNVAVVKVLGPSVFIIMIPRLSAVLSLTSVFPCTYFLPPVLVRVGNPAQRLSCDAPTL
ncbi:hypothetical protein [Streptomyces echinatus]|uniref:hypothetical protein n=1 Tax=Streptomyces echinatus TaxID=67293 RepID=UPI0031EE6EA4